MLSTLPLPATSQRCSKKVLRRCASQGQCLYGIIWAAVPELISLTDVKTNKGNIEKPAAVQVNISLMDADSDESLCITGIGSGQDSGDKAVMKAETAAIKYAYLLSLAISLARIRLPIMLQTGSKKKAGSVNPPAFFLALFHGKCVF